MPFSSLLFVLVSHAEEPVDHIALLEASIDAGITLDFGQGSFQTTTVKRRSLGSMTPWSDAEIVAELDAETAWTDPDSAVGDIWEYKVSRDGAIDANGFIAAAYDATLEDDRGKVALVIDSAIESDLEAELD